MMQVNAAGTDDSTRNGNGPPADDVVAASSTTPDAPPDWSAISEEIACPLCEYNLRGLVEPRCPECGYRFKWLEVLDPALRLHAYLFEHHPEANIRSFIRTLAGNFRPGHFWSRVHPHQPTIIRRLILYWLILAAISLLPLTILIGVLASEFVDYNIRARPGVANRINTMPSMEEWRNSLVHDYGSVEAYLDKFYPTTFWGGVKGLLTDFKVLPSWPGILYFVLWPWLTLGTLMIFRISMKRLKIRPQHVIRIIVYSSAAILPTSAWLLISVACKFVANNLGFSSQIQLILIGLTIAFLASALSWLYGLWMAVRHYLRFDHAAATVLASQAIVALIAINILFGLTVWR